MKEKRIKELVEILNKASYAYYNTSHEIMSNFEWDALRDELEMLENETGIILENSPTQNTGTEESGDAEKEPHEFPALSLAKTKNINDMEKWSGSRPTWIGWKLDGLTLICTYDNGKLVKLMTRGNGIVGKNITYLAPAIKVPKKIVCKEHMVIRGEGVISYDDFERINETIELDEQYANPRNLVIGTLGMDKSRLSEAKERNVTFVAFTLVKCQKQINSWGDRMDYLDKLGFDTVERELVCPGNMENVIKKWTEKAKNYRIPVDGLVAVFDDVVYAASGTVTRHHAANAGLAFKWEDEKADTVLRSVEWSCAINSITPVAVFDTVLLTGSSVSRASLCNISEMKRLGIGADNATTLKVIKSNMIIPKCVSADAHGTYFSIPEKCPVCGAPTEVAVTGKEKTETLKCTNPKCAAKHLNRFARFVSKDGMDIDGISIKSIAKLVNAHCIEGFADIFNISRHKDAILNMEGFGEKSYDNMAAAVNKSKEKTDYLHFIYALCIPMIGHDAVKKIIQAIGTKEFKNRCFQGISFEDIEDIGPEKSNSLIQWFADNENRKTFEALDSILNLEEIEAKDKSADSGICSGKTFVITGDVTVYKNRKEFKSYVEEHGGKVTGSVSSKTDFLVTNDTESGSSKNKSAKKLGIPIITEEQFINMFDPSRGKR